MSGLGALGAMDLAIAAVEEEFSSDLGLRGVRGGLAKLITAATQASLAMADAADADFMGDSYHEAIEHLRAALKAVQP